MHQGTCGASGNVRAARPPAVRGAGLRAYFPTARAPPAQLPDGRKLKLMEISNRATTPKALAAANTPRPSSRSTESCGVCVARGSGEKRGKLHALRRKPLLPRLLLVDNNTSSSLSSQNSPTRWKRHLSSDSYKCLRPFWKTITIQWLENCSLSFTKKEEEKAPQQPQQTTKTFSCIILASRMTKK